MPALIYPGIGLPYSCQDHVAFVLLMTANNRQLFLELTRYVVSKTIREARYV